MNDKMHTYDTANSDYHRFVHKLQLYNIKPTVVGCNFCDEPPMCIKQIRNNCLFKKKLNFL